LNVHPGVTPEPRPWDEPTTATFLILRKTLSDIVGKIVHHFQKLDEPARYSDVESLHMEIQAFIETLPRCYRMYDADKSLDKGRWNILVAKRLLTLVEFFWLPIHRFMLLTEVLVTIIILHVRFLHLVRG
jgi:hypothetical protein